MQASHRANLCVEPAQRRRIMINDLVNGTSIPTTASEILKGVESKLIRHHQVSFYFSYTKFILELHLSRHLMASNTSPV